jgi:putative Mg2+ transporter-C (MgtC) family protein
VSILGFPYIAKQLPKSRWTPSLLQVCYYDGREILREVLVKCTQYNFTVSSLQVEKEASLSGTADSVERTVTVALEVQGTGAVSKLAAKLADIDGVVSVNAGDVNEVND